MYSCWNFQFEKIGEYLDFSNGSDATLIRKFFVFVTLFAIALGCLLVVRQVGLPSKDSNVAQLVWQISSGLVSFAVSFCLFVIGESIYNLKNSPNIWNIFLAITMIPWLLASIGVFALWFVWWILIANLLTCVFLAWVVYANSVKTA